MKKVWFHKTGSDRLLLFFGGWGMDEHVVSHLSADRDVLMYYDYRVLDEYAPSLDGYREVTVVAWSMGVCMASILLNRWNIPVDYAVAINGTERPIDDRFGIPTKIYLLTEKGMDEKGRDKFFDRMFSTPEERAKFKKQLPRRAISEQIEELGAIRSFSQQNQTEMKWNKIYISREDKIFPPAHQEQWWRDRTEITYCEGGHYPFFNDQELIFNSPL